MDKNRIDVDAVLDALTERRRVNSIDIMEAVFMRDGKVLEVTHSARDDFRFTGLCNTDFVGTHIAAMVADDADYAQRGAGHERR